MLIVGPVAGRAGARFGHAKVLIAAWVVGVLGYAVLVVALDSIWAVLTCTTILGVAVGIALTAMVNFIVIAVDPDVTGQATGLNTILRTIGGSLGAQVTSALIVSTTTAELGYRTAFAACGGTLALLAVGAAAVTRRTRR